MSYGAVSVGVAATLIISANTRRRSITIVNDSSGTIYTGPDSSITTVNGTPLYGRQARTDGRIPEGYQGDIYGIIGAGTADVRYWEVESQ